MKLLMISLLSFCTLTSNAGVIDALKNAIFKKDNNYVYFYRIEYKNAFSEVVEDTLPERIAKLVSEKQEGSCIDLRSLGSNQSNNIMVSGTTGLLMNEQLDVSLGELNDTICAEEINGCSVQIKKKKYRQDKLYISASQVVSYHPYKTNSSYYSLRDQGLIPRFSEGCRTGKHSDSWNNAASTDEAKNYLEKIGVDHQRVRTLSLKLGNNKNDETVFSFGFL